MILRLFEIDWNNFFLQFQFVQQIISTDGKQYKIIKIFLKNTSKSNCLFHIPVGDFFMRIRSAQSTLILDHVEGG